VWIALQLAARNAAGAGLYPGAPRDACYVNNSQAMGIRFSA